jgi:epoxyqueuosine reductase
MVKFIEELVSTLGASGYKARIVSVSHLNQLKKEIEHLRNHALLDNHFYKDRLFWLDFKIPRNLPEAKSLIVVAVPRPQTRASFVWNGQLHQLIIPPTYTAYNNVEKQVEVNLAQTLKKKGYKTTGTTLPLKLLAAHSGLAKYGRNNISYSSKLGSFFQLVAFHSNMPCEVDSWQQVSMMKSCEKCELCRRACPTNAISTDRFLLRAERCIVYHNEKKGDVSFPEWMDVSWHNCIVGCMHCQRVCPENRELIKWIEEEEEFSEEETNLLLQGVTQERLPASTLGKLKRLSLTDYFSCLPRNLSVFLNKAK